MIPVNTGMLLFHDIHMTFHDRYELERLKPAVSNLCKRISGLPVTSSKQRLAQSEIAKKVGTYFLLASVHCAIREIGNNTVRKDAKL
jgi:hypothetical protein